MSKLNTSDIVKIVAQYAANHAPNVPPLSVASAANPTNWKRWSKSKVKKFLVDHDMQMSEIYPDFSGWAFVDKIVDQPIAEDCWCRHFVNPDFDDALDCYAITDATDSQVLVLFWHSD